MDDPLVWILIIVVVIAGAVGAFFLLRRRGGRVDDSVYHFRCPGCKRRLRFRAVQAGHTGQCSHCHRKLTFPPTSAAID